MQENSNTAHPKEISSIVDSLNSLPSSSNYGIQPSTSPSVSSSSSSSGIWSLQSTPRRPRPSFVRTTPTEILAHIFSYLDPEGFATASLVCREWHSVTSDDYAWKTAFDKVFGTQNMIARLSTTWRGEYTHRSHLLRYYTHKSTNNRKWEFGRGQWNFYDTGLPPWSLT